jgi:hypothetical protein
MRIKDMAVHRPSSGPVQQQVKQATKKAVANPWFERLARFGYASKGVVYLIAGLLTARAAFGLGGRAIDKNGALLTILAEPFGRFTLFLIAVGLIGYVLLRFVQALLDPEHKGDDPKGIAQRVGYLVSGLLYGGLALSALRLSFGLPGGAGEQSQSLVARVFAVPLGRWLVGIAGLIVIGAGLFQLYKAYSADFSEHFRWNDMHPIEQTWASWLGRIGLAARGIVQVLVGLFMVQAAVLFDPSRVQDSGAAVQSLAHPPFGVWTVGVVALGLAAYGVYMLVAARYCRIVTQ